MLTSAHKGIQALILDHITRIHDEIIFHDREYNQLSERPGELLKQIAAKLTPEDQKLLKEYDEEWIMPVNRQYDGHIFPAELIVPQNPEYRPLNRKISEIKETWRKKLSADDYKSLETMLELCCESSMMEASASFGYGFKLGAMIMLEVLGGKGELMRGGD